MKRLLSALLTLALVISLIPAAFAADGEVSHVEDYIFTRDDSHTLSTRVRLITNKKADGFEYSERGLNGTTYYFEKTYHEGYGDRGWRWLDVSDEIIELVPTWGNIFHFPANEDYLQMNHKASQLTKGIKVAFGLEAPGKSGFYYPTVSYAEDYISKFYIDRLTETLVDVDSFDDLWIDNGTSSGGKTIIKQAIYTTSEDEVMIALHRPAVNNKTYNFKSISLTEILGAELRFPYPKIELDVETNPITKTVVHVVGKAKTSADGVSESVNMTVSNSFVTFVSSNEKVAKVHADGTVEAVGGGEARITAQSKDGKFTSTNSVIVTVTAPQDPDLTDAFIQAGDEKDITDSYVAPTVTGLDIKGSTIAPVDNDNGTFTLEAPEVNDDGEAFLYWAKGMETQKRIISFSNVINDYVPAGNGKNYLIAVYEGDITDTTNEYYNLNGQLIAKRNEAPELPSIPGLGTAEAWERCGGNIYVAKYADTVRDNVTVTVNGAEQTVAYGSEIPCTAAAQDASGKPFKCWMKNDVIVSIDKTYTFHAWEDCTVEAVYEDHYYTGSGMKILIDSFDVATGVTGVMAEFIGFEDVNVVEKGIMFTATDAEKATEIPMTTTDNQLTVVADKAGTYVGYAILKKGDVYNLITDGSYVK